MTWGIFKPIVEPVEKAVDVVETTADITFATFIFISMLVIGLLWANKRAVLSAAALAL